MGDAQPGDLAHLFQPASQEREFIDVASIPDLDDRIGTPPNENHRNARTALDDDPMTDLDDDLNVRDGVAHVRDVTDKVRADDANRFQALLLSAVGQSVIASDADGVTTFWNAAAETMQLVLAYRATHDALTQLPNSASLRESLEVVLADADDQHRVAVAVVDIDHFKRVNDRSGRTTGDVALKCVAGRFRRDLRTTDIVARVGGDEFVLVRAGVLTLAHARTLASDALDLFSTEFDVGGRAMSLTASIGVGLSATGDTPASLIRDADNAMYQAKRDGRNRINVFDHLARASADRQQQIVDALPAAHADRLFRLEYQPVLDLSTSAVAGFEALLRWAHPELGNIAPDEFIPLAESTGLIVDIGRWVSNTALDQIATWRPNRECLRHRLLVAQLSQPPLGQPHQHRPFVRRRARQNQGRRSWARHLDRANDARPRRHALPRRRRRRHRTHRTSRRAEQTRLPLRPRLLVEPLTATRRSTAMDAHPDRPRSAAHSPDTSMPVGAPIVPGDTGSWKMVGNAVVDTETVIEIPQIPENADRVGSERSIGKQTDATPT